MKTTPLYQAHLGLGARMVPFAGYEMPLQYASITAEHRAVREGAGMFDVSHMGEFWVRGPGALPFLQYVTLNDVARLRVGRAQYSMLPGARGGVVDDIYLYRTAENEYLMVVNAANVEKDWAYLSALAEGFEVELENASDFFALIAVQGPQAVAMLQKLTDTDLLSPKKNDTFMGKLAGKWVRFARTGYTGEDGYEVFVAPDEAEGVWEALRAAGVTPCGLGARDTLRLEAGFPLYGHELTEETSPLCTPFAWVVKAQKDFYGKPALLGQDCVQRLVGLTLEEGIPREGYRVLRGDEPVGHLTSGTYSPLLRKGIAMAYVQAELAGLGTRLEVEIRGRALPAVVVELPFVRR
ncbi:Aminomethyltransferase [Meiothermus luteus]|jgi:aminomethyltransferase|uniref:Aminomethyltransferase n=1 Tax=Meiothermus luteus TaxID=2026184 RepID=A0A399EPF3_9DEIN|nr:glycine cleavage system aminomethyltransferase GcvT [Meiothermus luteus]RIH85858.1 Aminomethyltransferase [Meiothermus luteus]RMH56820.1 MAG: glycine cleavage system aminomethyltransferase GcvT [Deinococcota bacterium]